VNRTPGAAIRSRFRFGGIERLAVRVSVIDHRTVVTVRALGGAGIDRPQQTLVPSETIFQADAAATTDGPSAANRGPTQPLSSPFRRASATGLSANRSGDEHPVHTHRHTFEIRKVGDKLFSEGVADGQCLVPTLLATLDAMLPAGLLYSLFVHAHGVMKLPVRDWASVLRAVKTQIR
jgi:hypothetical protein